MAGTTGLQCQIGTWISCSEQDRAAALGSFCTLLQAATGAKWGDGGKNKFERVGKGLLENSFLQILISWFFKLQIQPSLFLSCLVPWGGVWGGDVGFTRLRDIAAPACRQQALSSPTRSHPQDCRLPAAPSAVLLTECTCVCLWPSHSHCPSVLPVLETKSKLVFGETVTQLKTTT